MCKSRAGKSGRVVIHDRLTQSRSKFINPDPRRCVDHISPFFSLLICIISGVALYLLPVYRLFEGGTMEQEETGCQPPEGPILCINNCGFFGSAATMNMCSKCHKDMVMKQEQAKLAASSIDSIVNGGNGGSNSSSGGSNGKETVVGSISITETSTLPKVVLPEYSDFSASSHGVETKAKEGPNRCNTCRKRVGLTGFSCRCGNLFCALHRYSDKHNCPFDYRTVARDAIAKANPVVKAEKLDKI